MTKGKRGNKNKRGGMPKSVRQILRKPKPAGNERKHFLKSFFKKPEPVKNARKKLPNPFLRFMLSGEEASKSNKSKQEKKPIWERRIEQYSGKTLAWHKIKRAELLSNIDRLFDQGNQMYARLTGMAIHNGEMSTQFVQLFYQYAACYVRHKQARQHYLANSMGLSKTEHGRMNALERKRFITEIKLEFSNEESFRSLIRDPSKLVREARETFESLHNS